MSAEAAGYHPAPAARFIRKYARCSSLPARETQGIQWTDLAGISAGTFLGGRYRVVEQIGSGAMANVYRATDESLGRDVAVKIVIKPRRQQHRGGAAGRRRRSDGPCPLNHHSLVTLLDAGEDRTNQGGPAFTCNGAGGGSGSQAPPRGRAAAAAPHAQIGYDLADALTYIHENGVIHRDVNPATFWSSTTAMMPPGCAPS